MQGSTTQTIASALNCSSVTPPTHERNILLIISDNHNYCQYGFTGGVCLNRDLSGSTSGSKTCRTDFDCQGSVSANPPCACRNGTLTVHLADSSEQDVSLLRLNDPTCRYRQQPQFQSNPDSSNWCQNGDPADPVARHGNVGDHNGAFPFNRTFFPCGGMYNNSSTPTPAVPVTLHLDRLATEGALFLRARAGGNQCKAARTAIHGGKFHRHLVEEMKGPQPHFNKGPIIPWYLDQPVTVGTGQRNYYAFLEGKGETVNTGNPAYGPGHGRQGFLPEGTFSCSSADPTACQRAEQVGTFPKIPVEARQLSTGIGDVIGWMRGALNSDGRWLARPFFGWYGPNIPLGSTGANFTTANPPVTPMYQGYEKTALKDAAAVTQLDLGIGAVRDELSRTCVCSAPPSPPPPNWVSSPESVLDSTVIIFLADQGYYLFASFTTDHENNHRTPLIISTPEKRAAHNQGIVYGDSQFVSVIDVLPTVLAYANVSAPADPVDANYDATNAPGTRYALPRNLKPWADATTALTDPIRNVAWGQSARDGLDGGKNRPHYLVTAPGQVGVCRTAPNNQADDPPIAWQKTDAPIQYGPTVQDASQHVKPCFVTADCGAGFICDTQNGKRCTNDPSTGCTKREDCTAPLCSGGVC